MKDYTDAELLKLYSIWSEEHYAASFMSPTKETVKRFKAWLDDPLSGYFGEIREPKYDYEFEMLKVYKELNEVPRP